MREEGGEDSTERSSTQPAVQPEGRCLPISDSGVGDAAVERHQRRQVRPVWAGQRSAPAIVHKAAKGCPDPACPRQAGAGMEAVQQLDQQALVLEGEVADPKSAFHARPADAFPSDEALGTSGTLAGVLEKSTPKSINGLDHREWEWHGAHGVDREGVEDCIQEDNAARRGQEQSAPPGQILVHLGNQWRKRIQTELMAGKWKPQIGLGKSFHSAAERTSDGFKNSVFFPLMSSHKVGTMEMSFMAGRHIGEREIILHETNRELHRRKTDLVSPKVELEKA